MYMYVYLVAAHPLKTEFMTEKENTINRMSKRTIQVIAMVARNNGTGLVWL